MSGPWLDVRATGNPYCGEASTPQLESSSGLEAPTTWRIGPRAILVPGARLHREEVRNVKKLILRVVYSSLALAAIVFVLGAPAKHPH